MIIDRVFPFHIISSSFLQQHSGHGSSDFFTNVTQKEERPIRCLRNVKQSNKHYIFSNKSVHKERKIKST